MIEAGWCESVPASRGAVVFPKDFGDQQLAGTDSHHAVLIAQMEAGGQCSPF